MLIYALHNDIRREMNAEFGYSEVWTSSDKGITWIKAEDSVTTNKGGPQPSFSMISCAASDAGQAYLVANRYIDSNKNSPVKYWYGAFKTGDGGFHWQWVWKGGGGSGQYGIKDGHDPLNLKDAWVNKAFGGRIYPLNGCRRICQ